MSSSSAAASADCTRRARSRTRRSTSRVIDRTNHHLFQPLLYQVATATLAPTDIAAPIRWLLRKQQNADVLLARGRRTIDVERARRRCDDGDEHRLRLSHRRRRARGTRTSAMPSGRRSRPGLKSIDDAIELRRRWLLAFERAERRPTIRRSARRSSPSSIVGGGPTGVELAGMLPTIARHALRRRLPPHRPDEGARHPRRGRAADCCPRFRRICRAHAQRDLDRARRRGAHERARHRDRRRHYVEIGDERIDAHTIFWAAGNAASPLGAQLGAPLDRAGRVRGERRISASPAIPRCSSSATWRRCTTNGKPVPGVAPAAMQSGAHGGEEHPAAISRRARREPFRYVNKGDLATIGRYQRGRRPRRAAPDAAARVVVLALRPHHVPGRLPQPPERAARVGVLVLHVPARRAADHGRSGEQRSGAELERRCQRPRW